MITNRIINRLLLLIRVPIECRGTMPSYCAHVATPNDAHAHAHARARHAHVATPKYAHAHGARAHAHGARARACACARAVGWGVEAQHVQQVKSLYLTKYLAIFV